MSCPIVMRTGANKGKVCGKPVKQNGKCGIHKNIVEIPTFMKKVQAPHAMQDVSKPLPKYSYRPISPAQKAHLDVILTPKRWKKTAATPASHRRSIRRISISELERKPKRRTPVRRSRVQTARSPVRRIRSPSPRRSRSPSPRRSPGSQRVFKRKQGWNAPRKGNMFAFVPSAGYMTPNRKSGRYSPYNPRSPNSPVRYYSPTMKLTRDTFNFSPRKQYSPTRRQALEYDPLYPEY